MKCLLDMDGVLVQFRHGSLRLHGLDHLVDSPELIGVWNFVNHTGLSEKEFWKPLGARFWSGLDWTCNGKDLLSVVEKYFGKENVCLLTSPCDTNGCYEGKKKWVKKHMPDYLSRFMVGRAKQFCAGSGNVLIDDSDHNCVQFSAAGGIGLLFPSENNSKHEHRHEAVKYIEDQLDFLFGKKDQ